MKTKKCNTCKEIKKVELFIPTTLTKSGFTARCRKCITARERELRHERLPDKICPSCKELRKKDQFGKGIRKCNVCNEKNKKISKAKIQNMGDLRETQYKLKSKAKMSLEELKKVEQDKLNNGYTWVDEQREFGKVRVLRKMNN